MGASRGPDRLVRDEKDPTHACRLSRRTTGTKMTFRIDHPSARDSMPLPRKRALKRRERTRWTLHRWTTRTTTTTRRSRTKRRSESSGWRPRTSSTSTSPLRRKVWTERLRTITGTSYSVSESLCGNWALRLLTISLSVSSTQPTRVSPSLPSPILSFSLTFPTMICPRW